MTFAQFLSLVRLTLRDPVGAAGQVVALLSVPGARWLALGAVVTSAAALGTLGELVFSLATGLDLGPPAAPVKLALVQTVLIVYSAAAMAVVGRQFGGRGGFGDALSLVVWIEAVMVVGQVAQIFVMALFPLASMLLTLALFGLMLWLLVVFTAALHGFDNLFWVGAGVMAVFFGSALLMGSVLLALGIVPPFMATS